VTSIAILGSGMMGSALAVPLADNGHDVRLVGTHLDREIIDSVKASGHHPRLQVDMPSSVRAYQLEDAETAFAGAEIVLSGVVSYATHWVGEQLTRLLQPDQLLLMVAKGMEASEDGDLRVLPDVLASLLPDELRAQVPISAIVGPCIAGELACRRHSSVIFAGRDPDVLDRLKDTFEGPYYHVWTSPDLIGAEVCAALKNCYALGSGLAEGTLERQGVASDYAWRNFNYEAALISQGVIESRRLITLLGGRPETAEGLATTGDMYVTAKGGRNVRVGRLIGAGMGFQEAWERLDRITLEGAEAIKQIGGALPKLTERGLLGADELPLLRHLHEVVVLERPLDMPWNSFFGGGREYAPLPAEAQPT
jgi:glycerol-3-phosphate dehydrogenase (NAD(P)+)